MVQAWREWPKRQLAGVVVTGAPRATLHAAITLECGHVVERQGYWVGPWSIGTTKIEHPDHLYKVHCGSCFHEKPKGHRSPHTGRAAFFADGGQLGLPGVDAG